MGGEDKTKNQHEQISQSIELFWQDLVYLNHQCTFASCFTAAGGACSVVEAGASD
jgi:hypothetical protein